LRSLLVEAYPCVPDWRRQAKSTAFESQDDFEAEATLAAPVVV
jgi:hypothetical protein